MGLCCQLVISEISAQQGIQVKLDAPLEIFSLHDAENGSLRISTNREGYFYSRGKNAPAIPLKSISVLVPRGARLKDLSLVCDWVPVKENVKLATAPLPVTEPVTEGNKPGTFTGSFSDEAVSYAGTVIQRGYTCFNLIYSPFRYGGESGMLSIATGARLEIEYTLEQEGRPVLRPDQAIVSYLKEKVVNPGDFARFYPENGREAEKLKSSPGRVDYLIITTEELKPSFQPLLDWKIRKGLHSRIVTVEEIDNSYDLPSIQEEIKQYLFDLYSKDGLTWVLMGGDEDVVPVQGCYSIVIGQDAIIEDYTIPTDLFYACFDGRLDWNSVVDDKIGQVHWDVFDLSPEIYISRLPLKNAKQVNDYIRKALAYETDPPLQDFFGEILFSGIELLRSWDGKSDSHHRSENLYESYLKNRWWGRKVRFYDTGTDFPGGPKYEVTAENLREQLNSGFGLVHFSGHGNTHYIIMEEGDVFSSADALSLDNTTPGIILANACHVNAFDSHDPCLSEAFLRNPLGGAIGFFGSSRFGFYNPDESLELGPSLGYNATFNKYLFNGTEEDEWKCFGTVAALAKNDFVNSGAAGGAYLYLQYAINPMGDPELPLYTDDPKLFDKVRLYRYGNQLTVNNGGIENSRICVSSQDLDEGYWQVVEDESFHTFKDIPVAFQVTVTAPGYRPYIYSSGYPASVENMHQVRASVYPNPAEDFIMIDVAEPEAVARLSDLGGRILREQRLTSGSHRMDLSAYPDGLYFIQVTTGSSAGTFRILKK